MARSRPRPSGSRRTRLRRLREGARVGVGRAKGVAFARVMSLPEKRLRQIAGKPVRIDGHELAVHTQAMLRLMRLTFERSAEQLPTVARGRESLRAQASMVSGSWPVGQVHERTVRGADGPLRARLYVPRGATGPGPLLVFFHGGGMVYGDLDSHDGLCRFLSEQAGVRVLSVDYRLAPEHPFPAGVDDAWAAFEWVASNAADYDADPARLALGGDSAGGYLAAETALRAAAEKVPCAFQLLIYPMAEMRSLRASRVRFGEGFFLTAGFMEFCENAYLDGHDPLDPRASPLHTPIDERLATALAPAYVVTAGFDPLRDEGQAYARHLAESGAQVEHELVAGQVHGFANVLSAETPALATMRQVAARLKQALTP